MGIKTIGAELAHPSFDLFFGFILAVVMFFSIYTVGTFIKAKMQARKRIQLPITAQGFEPVTYPTSQNIRG